MLAMREEDPSDCEPTKAALSQYKGCIFDSARAADAQRAGPSRRLHLWAMQAGFDRSQMLIGAGATVYTEPDETRWWAGVHVGWMEGEIGERWIRDKILKSHEETENMKNALTVWG